MKTFSRPFCVTFRYFGRQPNLSSFFPFSYQVVQFMLCNRKQKFLQYRLTFINRKIEIKLEMKSGDIIDQYRYCYCYYCCYCCCYYYYFICFIYLVSGRSGLVLRGQKCALKSNMIEMLNADGKPLEEKRGFTFITSGERSAITNLADEV